MASQASPSLVFKNRRHITRDVEEPPETHTDAKGTMLTMPARSFKALNRGMVCLAFRSPSIKQEEPEPLTWKMLPPPSAICSLSLSARGCLMWLPTASHHCTEMGSDELEFSSCLTHGISLFPVGEKITAPQAPTQKPESVIFMCLCPQIDCDNWACVLDEKTGRGAKENLCSVGGWHPKPHSEMASAQAPSTLLGQKAPQDLPLIPKPLLQPILVQLFDLITPSHTIGSLHSSILNEY